MDTITTDGRTRSAAPSAASQGRCGQELPRRSRLIAAGHDPDLVQRVIRLVDAAEYKRRQYPPGPKITQKNFGRDRRLPATKRWREHLGQDS
jgi:NH3-dependent NAD+ synthetase